MGVIMTAPLTREQTWQILEESRGLDERQTDNFIDYVAGELQNLDPSDEDVEHAISAARKALRLAGAN
jgi:hypothetical protein